MTITNVGAVGSAQNKTAGSSIVVNPTATLDVGDIIFARCVSDNLGTTTADSTEHTVTDSKGNTWIRDKERRFSAGAADDGVVISLWRCKITTQILTTDTVTLTLTSSRTSKGIDLHKWTVDAGNSLAVRAVVASNGTGTAVSIGVTGLTSTVTYGFLGTLGAEGPTSDTFTSDPDAGWFSHTAGGTTGGTATGNVASRQQRRLATPSLSSGTAETWNPTLGTSRDWAGFLIAYEEYTPAITITDAAGRTDSRVQAAAYVRPLTDANGLTDSISYSLTGPAGPKFEPLRIGRRPDIRRASRW